MSEDCGGAPETPKMGTQIIGKFWWICLSSPVAASLDGADSLLLSRKRGKRTFIQQASNVDFGVI